MILLISYRGLEEDRDFPEHSIMGEINERLLEALQVPYYELQENPLASSRDSITSYGKIE